MADIQIRVPWGLLTWRRRLPDQWSDMTPDQIWRCIDLLISTTDRSDIVRYLLDLPWPVMRRLHRSQMYDMIQCIDWMQIDQRASSPLAPYIPIRDAKPWIGEAVEYTRLYLPCAQWANVVGMEYALIDDLYHQYIDATPQEAQDIQDRMLAIILRPAGPGDDPYSDPRVRLISTQQTEQWLPDVRALSPGIKAYITLFISANIQYVYDLYQPWLFQRQADPEDTAAVSASSGTGDLGGGINLGWWGAFMDCATDGLFGDLDRVYQTPIHTICSHLIRKVDAARHAKIEHDMAMARQRR